MSSMFDIKSVLMTAEVNYKIIWKKIFLIMRDFNVRWESEPFSTTITKGGKYPPFFNTYIDKNNIFINF